MGQFTWTTLKADSSRDVKFLVPTRGGRYNDPGATKDEIFAIIKLLSLLG